MPLRYVLTGAPGAGKTVLLHALAREGHAVVAEAATDVITARAWATSPTSGCESAERRPVGTPAHAALLAQQRCIVTTFDCRGQSYSVRASVERGLSGSAAQLSVPPRRASRT